jgi:hypothetical protein
MEMKMIFNKVKNGKNEEKKRKREKGVKIIQV